MACHQDMESHQPDRPLAVHAGAPCWAEPGLYREVSGAAKGKLAITLAIDLTGDVGLRGRAKARLSPPPRR